MKFSFGKYKGLEISEIAEKNIGYIEWLISNSKNLSDEMMIELLKYRNRKAVNIEKEAIILMDYNDIKNKYVGKYITDKNVYWEILDVIDNSKNPALYTEKGLFDLYGRYYHRYKNAPKNSSIMGYGLINVCKLEDYDEISKEEFYIIKDEIIKKFIL